MKNIDARLNPENESLYTQLIIAAFFMFVIPLLLALYIIFNIIFEQNVSDLTGYARIVIFWIIASGIFGFMLIRKPIKALLAMIYEAKKAAEGNLDIKLNDGHRAELKDLAVAFNRLTNDLERKISELEYSRSLTRELFQKIGHAITSSQKLDALLSLIGQSIRKVLRGESSFISLYEDTPRKLKLKSYSGTQKNLTIGMNLPDNKGVLGFVIKNKKPMIIKKAGEEEKFISAGEEIVKYTTILSVPIIDKEQVVGVLGVTDLQDTQKIDTDDLFLMENIAQQIATSVDNFNLNKDIEETYYQTLLMLAKVVEAKDSYSAGHLERVSNYVSKIADKLRLDAESKKILTGGAILHDLGKVGIRDDVLKKESKFTKDEYEIMKQHSVIGENILKPLRSMSKLADLVRHHHELYDGSGYPDGLAGDDIPLSSRILTIADIYDALTTDRPYRKAMPVEEAIKTLRSYAGTRLDPKLVEVFISTLK